MSPSGQNSSPVPPTAVVEAEKVGLPCASNFHELRILDTLYFLILPSCLEEEHFGASKRVGR